MGFGDRSCVRVNLRRRDFFSGACDIARGRLALGERFTRSAVAWELSAAGASPRVKRGRHPKLRGRAPERRGKTYPQHVPMICCENSFGSRQCSNLVCMGFPNDWFEPGRAACLFLVCTIVPSIAFALPVGSSRAGITVAIKLKNSRFVQKRPHSLG
jgi:hypothetical protein